MLYQLSYVHRVTHTTARPEPPVPDTASQTKARLAGFEPAAHGLEVRCSIQLSYRRIASEHRPPAARSGGRAGDGVRTRDNQLGRLTLCQLSYTRLLHPAASPTMVGTRGFEPPTPCSQSRCATRLRHVPTAALPWLRPREYSVSAGRPDPWPLTIGDGFCTTLAAGLTRTGRQGD